MRRCVISNYRITAPFDQSRPLSAKKKTHIHGAYDYASDNRSLVAPEDGIVYYFAAIRNDLTRAFTEINQDKWPFRFGGNYFYDLYGGIIMVISAGRERIHLMTHSYRSQLFEQTGMLPGVEETPNDERFPICIEHTFRFPKTCREGDVIGRIGNAGFSTGPHVHHEVHFLEWVSHTDRVDWEAMI